MRPAFACGACAACCCASAPDRSKHRTYTNRFIVVPLQLTNVFCSWAPTFCLVFYIVCLRARKAPVRKPVDASGCESQESRAIQRIARDDKIGFVVASLAGP